MVEDGTGFAFPHVGKGRKGDTDIYRHQVDIPGVDYRIEFSSFFVIVVLCWGLLCVYK